VRVCGGREGQDWCCIIENSERRERQIDKYIHKYFWSLFLNTCQTQGRIEHNIVKSLLSALMWNSVSTSKLMETRLKFIVSSKDIFLELLKEFLFSNFCNKNMETIAFLVEKRSIKSTETTFIWLKQSLITKAHTVLHSLRAALNKG